VWLLGMLPAIGLFVLAYTLLEGKIRPQIAILIVIPFLFSIWFLFHELLHVPWPQSMIGDVLPDLRRLTGNLI
ncbi:MAG: hypothetical protein VW828_07035, partial [Candidatus Puniceispirillum sp.]